MNSLSDIGQVKTLLARHGLRLSKGLGQNFLVNPSVCPRMAQACGAEHGRGAIEIGPGIGVLTRELAQRAEKVVAIELDKRLFPVLEETLAGFDNVELVQGDVLKTDLHRLIAERFQGGPVCVCANLPYYITSPVIMRLLESGLPLTNLTVMVQKEAAQRLCAPPGVRACGAVSVSVHYHSRPEILFGVSRGSFLPPPKVDSAVVRFQMREEPPVRVKDEALLFRVARGAFAQRRKTAVNSLCAALGLAKAQAEALAAEAGIKPGARAEELTLEQLAALADGLYGLEPGGTKGKDEKL